MIVPPVKENIVPELVKPKLAVVPAFPIVETFNIPALILKEAPKEVFKNLPVTFIKPPSIIILESEPPPTEFPLAVPTFMIPDVNLNKPENVGLPPNPVTVKFGLFNQNPADEGIEYEAVLNTEFEISVDPEILSVPLLNENP